MEGHGMTDTPGQGTSDDHDSPGSPATLVKLFVVVVFGFAFYGGLGLLAFAAFGNQWARDRLSEIRHVVSAHPYLTIGGIALVIAVGILSWWFLQLFRSLADDTRRTAVGFLAVGVILLGTAGIVFLGVAHRLFAVQIAFFLVTALFPGALYYLFLRTRRPSILNEFTMNLWRLGLLASRHTYLRQGDAVVPRIESTEDLVTRVDSYFQKFEAVYGALRFDDSTLSRTSYVEAILQDTDKIKSRRILIQPTVRLADILTANIFIPLGFATFLSALGWLLVLEPRWVLSATLAIPTAADTSVAQTTAEQLGRLGPIATPLNFAFLGAYFFGLQALFRRFVRRDLGPNAFLAFSSRIILSAIGVWVIVVCFAVWDSGRMQALLTLSPISREPGLLVAAFVLGVFPRTLWQVITAALTKLTYVKLAVPSVEAKQPLDHLDGLTIWHESRLEEEDVENIPNMATADVVDLVLHTQIPAERLIDWMDQAILYKALGPEVEPDLAKTRRGKLRAQGIRTATQLVRVYRNADVAERAALDKTLGDGERSSVVPTIVRAIEIESNWDQVAAWRNVEGPPIDLPSHTQSTVKGSGAGSSSLALMAPPAGA